MSGSKLAGLESNICEVADMASLTACFVGDTLNRLQALKQEGVRAPLRPQEIAHIQFCVYHLDSMVVRLKADFYVNFDADKAEVRS